MWSGTVAQVAERDVEVLACETDAEDLTPEQVAELSGAREEAPIYGGQALIEGVMMRGPRFVAAAVRREDGEIVVKREAIARGAGAGRLLRLPLLRGVVVLYDAFAMGMRFLNFSGDVLMREAEEQESLKFEEGEATFDPVGETGVRATHVPTGLAVVSEIERTREKNHARAERVLRGKVARAKAAQEVEASADDTASAKPKKSSGGMSGLTMVLTLVVSFAIAITVFMMAPHGAARWLVESALGMPGEVDGHLPFATNLVLNLIEGAIRLALFLLYVLGIGQMREIRRVFQYHGAEHKVVYAVENEAPLTVEGARPFTTLHPRCGTNFIAIAICVAIILLSFLTSDDRFVRFGLRIAILPFVAAIAYEVLKLAGKCRDNPVMRVFILPGILLQKITTRPPDDDQVEVSVRAMKEVIALESRGGL